MASRSEPHGSPAGDGRRRPAMATWVGWGGESIVLKDRRAPYRPGERSPEWLKVKQRHRFAVRVESR